jgi:hypothetical protein
MKKQTMIVGIIIVIGLIAGVSGLLVTFAQENKPEAKEVTLKGEVVDMHCYIANGEKGANHAGCANACISRGVTPGFLASDGKLYLIFNDKLTPVKDKIANLAGQPVALTGNIVERDGVRAVILKHIEATTQGQ